MMPGAWAAQSAEQQTPESREEDRRRYKSLQPRVAEAHNHLSRLFPPMIAQALREVFATHMNNNRFRMVEKLCNEVLAIDHVEIDGTAVFMSL